MRKLLFVACLLTAACGGLRAQSVDYALLEEWNVEHHTASFDNTFRVFSNGNVYFLAGAPMLLLSGGLLNDDRRMIKAGTDALITLGVSSVVTWSLKSLVKRPRPFEKYPQVVKLSSGGGTSFPSGHTSSAFAMATSLSLSYPKWYVIVPCYLWAGGVGVSRIVLGVHYPSDVLAGAVVGAGSAWLTHRAGKWLRRDKNKRPAPASVAL